MSKDNGELEKSVKEIPSLVKSIKTFISTLKFSAEAKDEILDGTNLILPEKLEITEKVMIKEEDKEVPAPDGKYKFEDNKDIITVKNGVIKNIEKVEAAEHQVTDVKTTEGIILRYDAETPEIGLDIFVVKDTGQEPAPDGEHTLENGMILTVQDGKITNVTNPEGAKDENKEEDMAKVQELIGQLKALGMTVETMKTENKELKKDNEEIKKEHTTLSETLKLTFKIVEIISEQPSEKSEGTKGTFASDEEVVDIVAKVADFKADIKRLRRGQTN